tara:strand:- start:1283 stop:10456 length:9174 start_codon:yes stop_codon:yes gene_type:complete
MAIENKLTVEEFATKIRNKFNAYQDIEDSVLVDKFVKKYPVYEKQIKFNEIETTAPTQTLEPGQGVLKPDTSLEPGQGVLTPETFESEGKLTPVVEETAPAAGEEVAVTDSVSVDGGLGSTMQMKNAKISFDDFSTKTEEEFVDEGKLKKLYPGFEFTTPSLVGDYIEIENLSTGKKNVIELPSNTYGNPLDPFGTRDRDPRKAYQKFLNIVEPRDKTEENKNRIDIFNRTSLRPDFNVAGDGTNDLTEDTSLYPFRIAKSKQMGERDGQPLVRNYYDGTTEEELVNIIDVFDTVQQDAFENLYRYGIVSKDTKLTELMELSDENHRAIEDLMLGEVERIIGEKIYPEDFNTLYLNRQKENKLIVEDRAKKKQQKDNLKVGLDTEFKENQLKGFYNAADPKQQIKIDLEESNFKLKQDRAYYEGELKKINNKEYKTEGDRENAKKLLNLEITRIDNKMIANNAAIKDNAAGDLSSLMVKAFTGGADVIVDFIQDDMDLENKTLASSYFGDRGYSEESVKQLAKIASDSEQNIVNKVRVEQDKNPQLTQQEAVRKLLDNELKNMRQAEVDGMNAFVTIKGRYHESPYFQPTLPGNKAKVSFYDLRKEGYRSGDFEGFLDEIKYEMSDRDIASFKAYNELVDEYEASALGYYNLGYKNIDIGEVEKNNNALVFGISAAESTLGWFGYDEREAQRIVQGENPVGRALIDNLDQAINNFNSSATVEEVQTDKLYVSDKQKENIEKTIGEEVAEGVGHFVPDLVVLGVTGWATGGVMNAIGLTRYLKTAPKLIKHGFGAALEEAKMQTILDMKPGGGAAFYTLGAATSKVQVFKKGFKWLNPLFDKVVKSGVVGAASAEFAGITELAYDSFMGNKLFADEFNEMYGSLSDVSRRLLVNATVFSMTGAMHVKRNDFRSTSQKYKVKNEIKNLVNEIVIPEANKSKVKELQQEIDNIYKPKQLVDKAQGVNIPSELAPKKRYYNELTKSEQKRVNDLQKEIDRLNSERKTTADLTPKERKKLETYSGAMQTLDQMIAVETMHRDLDPTSPEFEANFNRRITNPMNKAIQAVIPEFKGVDVVFGKGKEFRRNNFETNGEGKDLGNTAQYDPKSNKMYFDMDFYTPGKAVHEFTHAAEMAYMSQNPTAKRNFTKRLGNVFKDFNFGEFEGTELAAKIKEKYNIDLRTVDGKNLEAREYLAFMAEFMANPEVYYTNPNLASSFMNEFRLEVKNFLVENGLKTPIPKTAKDMVQMLALLGKDVRMGSKFDVKIQQLAKLDEIDILGTNIILEAAEGKKPVVASKELSKKEDVVKTLSKENISKAKQSVQELVEKSKGDIDKNLTKEERDIFNAQIEVMSLDALGFRKDIGTPGKVKIPASEAISYANQFLPGILRRYKKSDASGKTRQFSTLFYGNIKPKRQAFYGKQEKLSELGRQERLGDVDAEGREKRDVVSTDLTPEEAMVSKESQDRKDKVTPRAKLIRDFPEIFDQEVKDLFETAGLEIFEGETPAVEAKEFKGFTTEVFRQKTTAKIKKKLGTGKTYEFNVKKLAPKLKENLPIQWFVRMEGSKPVNEKKFTTPPKRLTKQADIDRAMLNDKVYVEVTTQGVNAYEFKDFTAKDLADFILAPLVNPKTRAKSGTRGTRKTGFAEGLVDLFGRQVSPTAIKQIPKLEGKLPQISAKLQVDPRTKFASKELTKRLQTAYDLVNKNRILTEKDKIRLKKGLNIENEKKLIDELDGARLYAAIENGLKKSDLKKLEELNLEKDVDFFEALALEDVAIREQRSIEETQEIYMGEEISFIDDGKKLKASMPGTTYRSAKDRASSENFKKSKPYYLDIVKNLIPKGELFSSSPSSYQKMIMNTIGMGDHRGRTNERKFTFKEYGVEEGNYTKLLEKVYDIKEADLIGKGPAIEGEIFIPAPASKSKVTKAEGSIDFRAEAAKVVLGRGQTSVDAVLNANKAALQNIYNAAKNVIKNAKNKTKALDHIIDLMLEQTNRSIGGIKGLVGIESAAMEGLRGSNPELTKELHNEHLTELFTMTKNFGKMMERFIKGEQSEKSVDLQLKRMVEDYNQGIISEQRRELKDFTGASRMDYINNLIFLGKDAYKQIPLRESTFAEAANMAEVIRNNATKTILDRIKNTPYNKLTLTGVVAKQRLENTAQNKRVEKQTKELASESKMASKDLSNSEIRDELNKRDKAFRLANEKDKKIKKARVFDFDDTIARTKSNVLYTMPDGRKGKLTAEEFAKKGDKMLAEGAVWDFSEFNKVVDGKKGPLFEVMKKMKEAAGERDMFVLTARSQESAKAIHTFLKEMGIDIPLENIKGLGDSSPFAKSDWIVGKAAEGYNDFYFADDHKANVKAVRDVLEVLDVKSQTQQALASKDLSGDFNKILEESKGIGREKIFSDVKAELRGTKARRQKFFIPPSAEDFMGLLYPTLGKGRQGEAHLKFYKESLFDPYSRAMENLSTDRVNLMADFKELKKQLDVPKDLRKETESGFTNEQAVRTYLWAKTGREIPGLSKSDFKELNDIVEGDAKLKAFAEQILSITKGDGYSKPGKNWAAGTITTDLMELLNTTKRSKYLETWQQNADLIFSKDNMNKLEAAFGKKYRESLESALSRMKAGTNRIQGGNKLSNQVLDYINNSTGVVMFLNMRSAVLQTISAANFVNWSFNNPLKAGKAFANQPQYWADFKELMNSDYLKDRRNGLKLNINESEIANAAKTSKNKAKAVISYIIEKGYTPTKFADSFAIASGGATFYRNRINDLMKNEGKTEAEAKKQAMEEFRKVSELSQQSSDPSKISKQQSGDLGRMILQYVNTPMQYARLQKRDIQDIANKRRIEGKTLAQSNRTRLSRIAYYGFIQNLMFNALQQGLFALGMGDGEIDPDEEKTLFKSANGMLDSSLRGLGLAGVTVQVLKNLVMDVYDRSQRDRPEYVDAWQKLLDFSPAIKSKMSKFKGAAYPFDSKKRRAEVFDKGFSLDNPAYESLAKVIAATTNIPLDRLYTKTENVKHAFDENNEAWQSVAMILGWPSWQVQDGGYKSSKKEVVIPRGTIKKSKTKYKKRKTTYKKRR